MPIQELENKIHITRNQHHSVFIPLCQPSIFKEISNQLFAIGMKTETGYTLRIDRERKTLNGSCSSVHIESYLQKQNTNYGCLTKEEKAELEWAYIDKVLGICKEMCDKYKISLYYKAHLLFPIEEQGMVTFLNYEITPNN